jgi:hypothetical protein
MTTATENGVNVEALLGVRDALAGTPEIARFQWRSAVSWLTGHTAVRMSRRSTGSARSSSTTRRSATASTSMSAWRRPRRACGRLQGTDGRSRTATANRASRGPTCYATASAGACAPRCSRSGTVPWASGRRWPRCFRTPASKGAGFTRSPEVSAPAPPHSLWSSSSSGPPNNGGGP